MHKTRYYLVIGAIGITAALALSACGGSGTGGGSKSTDQTIGTPDGTGKTLTVWAMESDLSPDTLDAINAEFTKQSGAKVKLEVQPWADICLLYTSPSPRDS